MATVAGDNTRLYDMRRLLLARQGTPTVAAIISSVNGALNGSGEIRSGSLLLLQCDAPGWVWFYNYNQNAPVVRDIGIKLKADEHYYFTLGGDQNSVLFQAPNGQDATLRVWSLA